MRPRLSGRERRTSREWTYPDAREFSCETQSINIDRSRGPTPARPGCGGRRLPLLARTVVNRSRGPKSRSLRADYLLVPAAAGNGADAVLLDLARLHVEDVALREHEIRLLPRLVDSCVVVHGDLEAAEHFEAVAGNDDRGVLGQSDAEQIRHLLDDGNQVIPAVARVDVLVDRRSAQKRE